MQLTYTIDGYDRCRLRTLPSMPNHERKLYHPDDADNDRRRDIRATGMDGRWSMGSEVEIWRTGSLLDVFLFLSSLLLFFGSRPGINGVGTGFTTSGSQSMGGGVSPCGRSTERSPCAVLLGCGTDGFVRLCTWNGCLIASFPFLSFPTLVQVYAAQEVCT